MTGRGQHNALTSKQPTAQAANTTTTADHLALIAYESGVSLVTGIKSVETIIHPEERTKFDSRLIERYKTLQSEYESQLALYQSAESEGSLSKEELQKLKPKFSNGMQSSVVSSSLDRDGVLTIEIAPTPYLYVVAFQQLIKEGVIGLDEREATSPNMLGTGFYASTIDERGIESVWCQVKGQKGGVDVMGAGEVHSAFVGGSVGAKDLQSNDPLRFAARRENFEEQGFQVKDEEFSSDWMIVKEIETGNFNIYRTVHGVTEQRVVDAFQSKVDQHYKDGNEGLPEVAAIVLVPVHGKLIEKGDRRYAIAPTKIIGVQTGEVVVIEPTEADQMLGRPHTIGYLAERQANDLV